MNLKRIKISIFILLIIVTQTEAQNIIDDMTTELFQVSKTSSIKGFGVAVFRSDSVLYKKGFGYIDENNTAPYTIHTVQKIASISKTLLGVALMKAVELDLLELNDDVNLYLPFTLKNPYLKNDLITIRHLATHTSGLKKTKKDLNALYFPTKIGKVHKELPFGLKRLLFWRMVKILNSNKYYSLEKFLFNIYDPKGEWYKKSAFEKSPAGTKYIYSNTGASLIALIIEKASGVNYEEFVRAYILSPLQMKETYFDFEKESRKQGSNSELFHGGIKIPNDYNLILYPAGGLETSVSDFAHFMSAMIQGFENGNKILDYTSFQTMMSNQIKLRFDQGILWEVYPDYIGHMGDIAGATTFTYFDRKKGIGYLLFCNTAATLNIDEDFLSIKDILKDSFDKF